MICTGLEDYNFWINIPEVVALQTGLGLLWCWVQEVPGGLPILAFYRYLEEKRYTF
jgi:hypothetical protein